MMCTAAAAAAGSSTRQLQASCRLLLPSPPWQELEQVKALASYQQGSPA